MADAEQADGTRNSSRAPHDNIAGFSQEELDAILELKKSHFTTGPAQIRAQLKRFRGRRIGIKAIARALKANGYKVEHKSARNEQELIRFEAPIPDFMWMMDALSSRVHEQRLYLHLLIDDFSSGCPPWPWSNEWTDVVRLAAGARHLGDRESSDNLVAEYDQGCAPPLLKANAPASTGAPVVTRDQNAYLPWCTE